MSLRESTLAATTLSRGQAGWGFGTEWDIYVPNQNGSGGGYRRPVPAETGTQSISSAALRSRPFFGPLLEAGLTSTNSSTASAKAGDPWVQYDVLARGIPAKSYAVATSKVNAFGETNNFNMEQKGRTQGQWPAERHTGNNVGRWLHSDFKNVALPYVYPMFEEMIKQGALQ